MIKRIDLILIGVLTLVGILLLVYLYQEPGLVVSVEIDGEIQDRILLSEIEAETVFEKTYQGAFGSIVVAADPSGAWVKYAECPDLRCMHSGKISRVGECILCLPGRICLRVEGNELDGITG